MTKIMLSECDEIINHVLECPYCLGEIQSIMASRAGSATSEKKATKAARQNGMKGGRPRKEPGPHGPVSERFMRHYYGANK